MEDTAASQLFTPLRNQGLIMPLVPGFTMGAVGRRIQRFADSREKRMIEALAYVGETFVNRAREIDTYKDRTGNLRSSLGYSVLYNGEPVKQNFKQYKQGVEGKAAAQKVIDEFRDRPGFILIGFAGMEYAAAVESKGYDVITGSSHDIEALMRWAVRHVQKLSKQ